MAYQSLISAIQNFYKILSTTLLPCHIIAVSVAMATVAGVDVMLVSDLTHDYDLLKSGATSDGAIYISKIDFNSPLSVGPSLEFQALPLADVGNPMAVNFDSVSGMVYWLDYMSQTIFRANLNGTNQHTVVSGMAGATGFVLDPTSDSLYWTDEGNHNIGRVNVNGSDQEIIVNNLELKPRPIVIDYNVGHIYWAEWEEDKVGKIQRALSDGTHVTPIIQSELIYPNGLALDSQAGFLYWCDAGTDKIEKATLTGQDRAVLFFTDSSFNMYPFAMALHIDYLYWTDWSIDQLTQIHVDNDKTPNINNGGPVGKAMFHRASGVHIQRDFTRSCFFENCNNKGTCVDSENSFYCTCQHGYHGNTCEIETPYYSTADEPNYPKLPYITEVPPTTKTPFEDFNKEVNATAESLYITEAPPKTISPSLNFSNTTNDTEIIPVSQTTSPSNKSYTKRLHLIINLTTWTLLFIVIIIVMTIIYHKMSCVKKIKSLYETTMFKTDDQRTLEDYHTVSETKPKSEDYATSIKFKMADGSFHHQDNPGYITTTGNVAVVGLQPRYVNMSPPNTDDDPWDAKGESLAETLKMEQPPEPPSVGKLTQLVQSQKV